MKLLNAIDLIAALLHLRKRIARLTSNIRIDTETRRWRRKMLRDLNRRRRC